jgi:thymidylate synthase (FAD)
MSDIGMLRLDAAMADDLSVVNSARISFAKRVEEMSEADIHLINYLMRERHGTPFEHNSFRFHVRCPIFVAREWFRHRIGSFNEFSGRYSEFTQDAYIPEPHDVRTQTGKPGDYIYEPLEEEAANQAIKQITKAYDTAFETYRELLSHNVAKELARIVLPVGAHTEFYWTVNARSLMNFISLRTAQNAQREIQAFAVGVEEHFAQHMPHTWQAFNDHGRKAP